MTKSEFRPMETAYFNADSFLGKRESRLIENHTYLKRRDSSTIAVCYHNTDVVTYNQDESIILNTGRWRTVSTKDRLNEYNPLGGVYVEKGNWWYQNSCPLNKSWAIYYEFKDRMLVQSDGTPDARIREIVMLENITGLSLTEETAAACVAGLDLPKIKAMVKNRYLRRFALKHCRREFVPAFLNNVELAEVIEGRMKNEQDSR